MNWYVARFFKRWQTMPESTNENAFALISLVYRKNVLNLQPRKPILTFLLGHTKLFRTREIEGEVNLFWDIHWIEYHISDNFKQVFQRLGTAIGSIAWLSKTIWVGRTLDFTRTLLHLWHFGWPDALMHFFRVGKRIKPLKLGWYLCCLLCFCT